MCDDISSSFDGKFEKENDEHVYQNNVRIERCTHIKPGKTNTRNCTLKHVNEYKKSEFK